MGENEEEILNNVLLSLSGKMQIEHISSDTDLAMSFSGLTIQPHQHRVILEGREVAFSHLEFATLLFLAKHPGWVFSKNQIYEAVWNEPGEDCGAAVTNVISQIRKKLGSKYIKTVIRSGYKCESIT